MAGGFQANWIIIIMMMIMLHDDDDDMRVPSKLNNNDHENDHYHHNNYHLRRHGYNWHHDDGHHCNALYLSCGSSLYLEPCGRVAFNCQKMRWRGNTMDSLVFVIIIIIIFFLIFVRIHFISILTPLAWSPLQASLETLRLTIDEGKDVPAAFRATTKKLRENDKWTNAN